MNIDLNAQPAEMPQKFRKTDCFALNKNGKCSATQYDSCEGCSFYKTKELYLNELIHYNGTDKLSKILKSYADTHEGGQNNDK